MFLAVVLGIIVGHYIRDGIRYEQMFPANGPHYDAFDHAISKRCVNPEGGGHGVILFRWVDHSGNTHSDFLQLHGRCP